MDTDDATHRSVNEYPGEYVEFRDADEVEEDDGMMAIRMPIASTGAVRNEGDDPLTASELRGMSTQINADSRGVFLEHGMADAIDRATYTQTEKLGYWTEGDLRREASDDGEDLLMATARMPDPETLPAATDEYRTTLAIIKEQAKRGIPIMSSIGWRDDDSMPGGVDLLETSIVGIAADPRTNTEDDAAEVMARAAVDAGADPEALVDAVHAAVGDDTDQHMTDDDPGDDEAGTDTEEQTADDGETSERVEAPEWAADIRDLLEDIHDAVREDGMDDDEDDEDDENEQEGGDDDEEDDEDEEQSADTDGEQSADDADADDADGDDERASALADRLDTIESELADVRSGETDVESPGDAADGDGETDRDADDGEQRDDDTESLREGWLADTGGI